MPSWFSIATINSPVIPKPPMGEGPQPPEEDQQESGEADETDTVLTA